ncbi:hypothetical protein BC567DRAFT_100386 [Phyllosticta citribraziliensis]
MLDPQRHDAHARLGHARVSTSRHTCCYTTDLLPAAGLSRPSPCSALSTLLAHALPSETSIHFPSFHPNPSKIALPGIRDGRSVAYFWLS